jgi:UDP-N-acetyl-2-amino-2-deoxyglucuronate dehydrogenase
LNEKVMRAGIIGLGVGEQHLKTYNALPNVEVKAICDIDTTHLATVADRYDVPGRSADFHDITEDPEIDVVSICSYDDKHADQAISAFNNGKHVMVEKPVALHRHEAEAVLRAQQDSGCRISSNLILRESPRFIELRRQIQDGEFGDVFCIEGDYLHDILWKITEGWRGQMNFYCTIFGGGIHLIDLMRWLIGQEVVEVCGMGNNVLTKDSAYRFDDTFINLLRFDGGTIGKCLSTFGPQRTKFHALNVYGTSKSFTNDLPNAKLFDGDAPENESAVETPYPGMKKGDLIPEFVQAIRDGAEPNVGARDVFRVMDICFAAWEASQSGKTIKVSYQI